MRTVRVIRTSRHRAKVKKMIKEMKGLNLKTDVKNNNFDSQVNHVIEINDRIKKIVWKGRLLRSSNKYKALKLYLKSPNHQGILNSLLNSYPDDHERTYTRLVKEFFPSYVNKVARKTCSLAYGVSIRKGKKLDAQDSQITNDPL